MIGSSPVAMGSIARIGVGVPTAYNGGGPVSGLGDTGLGSTGLGALGDLVIVSVAAQLITPIIIAILRKR